MFYELFSVYFSTSDTEASKIWLGFSSYDTFYTLPKLYLAAAKGLKKSVATYVKLRDF